MRLARLAWVVVAGLVACDDSFERAPRATPASESQWMLVGLQLKYDAIRPFLVKHPGLSVNAERVDRLNEQILATSEVLTAAEPTDDELRAARYRVDLIAVAWDLVQADVLASAGRIGGASHATTLQGLGWIEDAFKQIRQDPRWPVRDPRKADRYMLMAVSHRDNLRRAIPVAALMRDGANAAALTSGEIGAVRLAMAGARVLGFVGGGPAIVSAGFAEGAGSIQVLAGGRALALTTQEVVSLVNAGVISSAALALYLEASDLHHICTDKNQISDKQGGPWTPRYEEIFKKAGMSLQDSENLVRVRAHQGPHPLAYHSEIMRRLSEALTGKVPGTSAYREALKQVLAKLATEIQTPGTRLNLLVTGATAQ
jgi:HNH/ENDO VII superfamily nuclease